MHGYMQIHIPRHTIHAGHKNGMHGNMQNAYSYTTGAHRHAYTIAEMQGRQRSNLQTSRARTRTLEVNEFVLLLADSALRRAHERFLGASLLVLTAAQVNMDVMVMVMVGSGRGGGEIIGLPKFKGRDGGHDIRFLGHGGEGRRRSLGKGRPVERGGVSNLLRRRGRDDEAIGGRQSGQVMIGKGRIRVRVRVRAKIPSSCSGVCMIYHHDGNLLATHVRMMLGEREEEGERETERERERSYGDGLN
jgi:hypothetical protein